MSRRTAAILAAWVTMESITFMICVLTISQSSPLAVPCATPGLFALQHDTLPPRPRTRANPGAHEHRQPPLQPGADPFHPRPPGQAGREKPIDLQRRQDQI